MLDRQPENGEIIPQGDEKRLVAEFYLQAVKNNVKSDAAGRPIFDEIQFVRILIPGDRNTRIESKAKDEHRERFPRAWQRFQQGKTVAQDGTPIDTWPPLGVREVAELKAMNIFTVEALAELQDGFTDKFMGMRDLREKARAYLKAAKDGALVERQAVELAKRDDEIAALKEQMATLTTRFEEAMTPKKAKAA